MTTPDLANAMRRLADALDRLPRSESHILPYKPVLEGDYAVGAARFWDYLRSRFTMAGKEQFTRDEVLVLLDTVSKDAEIFPPGLCQQLSDACEEERG